METLLIVDPIGVLIKFGGVLLLFYLVGRYFLGRRYYE